MTTDVRVISTQSARIRPAQKPNPHMSLIEIAKLVKLQPRVVRLALGEGDTFRRKSLAK